MLPVHVLVSRATAPFACFRARFRMPRESDRANRRSDSSAARTTRIRPTPSRVRIEAMKSTTRATAHAASPRSMRTSPLRALPERALRAPVSQALLPSYSPSVSGAVSSRRRCRAPARHVSTLKRLRLDTASAGAPHRSNAEAWRPDELQTNLGVGPALAQLPELAGASWPGGPIDAAYRSKRFAARARRGLSRESIGSMPHECRRRARS